MGGVKIQIADITGIQRMMRRMIIMRVIAVLEINEKKLSETGHSFEEEMDWVAQSGITLKEYQETSRCSAYEYAAFVFDTSTREYVQVGNPVATELLCKNRYEERVMEKQLLPSYDTDKVVFRKRLVSALYSGWEDITDGN